MKVAVVGATGLVGTKMLQVLAERNFPVTEIVPVASERSVGKDVSFKGKAYKVALDAEGYTMTFKNSKPALLRKTSTNSYFYQVDNQIAIGYFDVDGNLIIEKYDTKLDKVTSEKFGVVK